LVAFNKFQDFVRHLADKVHDLLGTVPATDCDTVRIYLSNVAPDAALDSVKADLAEIATGNGYAGPIALVNYGGVEATGTFTMDSDQIVITASGGSIAQFRYVVLYNDTPVSPVDPLMGWWDYGSGLTLADGESLTVKFNNLAADGTVLTLA